MIVQKSAFLASEASVNLSIFFQKKIGAGFFGGEGFIMQKLSGHGTVFVEIDGYAVEYNLAAGQSMVVDTGSVSYTHLGDFVADAVSNLLTEFYDQFSLLCHYSFLQSSTSHLSQSVQDSNPSPVFADTKKISAFGFSL